jgi:hypothetical protein
MLVWLFVTTDWRWECNLHGKIFMWKLLITTSLLIVSVFALKSASATDCAPLIGTCEYYQCVERQLLSCGQTGYTMGYGYYYCKKFEAVHPRPFLTPHEKELFPVEWGEWLSKTAQCLHSAIDDYFPDFGTILAKF